VPLTTDALHARLRTLASLAANASMLVSAAVLFGWAAGIPWLTGISTRFLTMKPVTAVCFFLCGFSLRLQVPSTISVLAPSNLPPSSPTFPCPA
jgi:hypothetical protein